MKILLNSLASILLFASLNAGEIAEKMAANAKNLKSLYAEFTQERTLALLEDISVSKGFLVSDESGAVRWQIDEPFKAAMISDAKGTSHFDFKNGEWSALKTKDAFPIGKIVGEIRKLIMGGYSESAYLISEANGKLSLVPANETARKFVSEILITPNADFSAPKKIEIKNPNGDFSVITFTKIVANPKNASSAFASLPLKDYMPE